MEKALLQDGAADREIRRLVATMAREPQHLQLRYDLALHLLASGRFLAARDVLTTLLNMAPDQAEANFMLGQLLLLLGQFPEGWARYAWRYRMEYARSLLPRISQPCWPGGSLAGKTLIVFGEQGYGDTIQFARFIPLLLSRGEGRIVVGCSPPLRRLLRTLPGQPLVVSNPAHGQPFDWQTPVSALPGLVGADLHLLAALPVPYLWADPVEVERWRVWRQQAVPTRRAVGVVWAGRSTHPHDAQRSIPWTLFSRLHQVPEVTLVSLQLPTPSPDVFQQGLLDVSGVLVDFAATAAAMMALDLIVTVDTAIAHLAGALGRPVWTLITRVPDWRWLLERDDSPWYPTMRLFRQQDSDDWSAVMEQVVAALRQWTTSTPPSATLPAPAWTPASTASLTPELTPAPAGNLMPELPSAFPSSPAPTPVTMTPQPHTPRTSAAWDPIRQGSTWRWPQGPFLPPHPPLQEFIPCRCCGNARSGWVAAVDYSRCQADGFHYRLPHAGIPVDYYHCAQCGCRFTNFFDHWEPELCRQLAVDPLQGVFNPDGNNLRQKVLALLETGTLSAAQTNHILVMDSDLQAWENPPGNKHGQMQFREPFQDLPPENAETFFAAILLVDTLHRHAHPGPFLNRLTRLLHPQGSLLLALTTAPEDPNQLVFPAYTPRSGLALLHTNRSLKILFRHHGLRWQQSEPGLHVGKRK
ncbi:MAG: hypothetical protein HQL65_13380 [Magnetococcales bacterium]|nr:hypothetical protein [Magnetococcales bacterium]